MLSVDVTCRTRALAAGQTVPKGSGLMSDDGVWRVTLPRPYTRPDHLEVVASCDLC